MSSSEAVDITSDKDGGVLKEIVKAGVGEASPPKGVKVTVHYTGKLTNGKVFDSSRDRGTPFDFNISRGSVIRAWDIGVATMKKGEQCILTCREDYAYGNTGSPPDIPPGATLIFEVELIDWEPENLSGKNDKGILRHPIEEGTGIASPKEGALVEVTLVGESEGKVFFDKRLSFCLGEGIKSQVPRGIERALQKMVMREKSRLELTPAYGWGKEGNAELGVAPDTPLTYTVTLHSFEVVKDPWMMSSEESIEHGGKLKEKGTKYFKEGDMKLAAKMYNRAVELLKSDVGHEEKEDEERRKLLLSCYLNLSMTSLKQSNLNDCKDMCNKVLQMDQDNVKALFRRGQAYLGLNEPQLAKVDFKKVLSLEPKNTAASAQLALAINRQAYIKEKEKKIYSNMFARKDKEVEVEKQRKEEDVMQEVGEWGMNERDHDPTEFEKENPNILMLNKDGEFKDM